MRGARGESGWHNRIDEGEMKSGGAPGQANDLCDVVCGAKVYPVVAYLT